MKKLFLSLFFLIFISSTLLTSYLVFFGFETSRLNDRISEVIKKSDKNILVYDIIVTDNALNINNKRFDYYKKNRFIPVNCIGRDKQITRDDIYFDVASKNISMKSYNREELLKIWFQKQNNIKN